MKVCLGFIIGSLIATFLTIVFGFKYKFISFDQKNGFSEAIPQKMNRVNEQNRYSFSYVESSNLIRTYKNGEPFLLEGKGDIFGVFDSKGLVFGGELSPYSNLKDLDFVFFNDDYIYVFDWGGIKGTKYKRK